MSTVTSAIPATPHLSPFVLAAAGGDREAFAHLVDSTSSLVSSITLAILRDVEASRDVAQDVFLAAWRDLAKLRNPASFLPWLRQITRNRAHEALRNRIRVRKLVVENAGDDALAEALDRRPGVAERFLEDEERRLLADAIDALPEEAREVVTLFYREGQSVRQVADLLDLSEDAVKQRLSRARARLRESVLARVGEVVRKSAPGAAFTGAVLGAIAVSPGTAAAAGLGASVKIAGSGSPVKLAAVFGGAGLGAASGVAAVLVASRKVMTGARDEKERRDLRRFTAVTVGLVIAACAGMVLGGSLTKGPWLEIVLFALFIVSLGINQWVWLPRIVARRIEAEYRENPQAWIRHRRGRRLGMLGFILGALMGTAGLVLGILAAAR